LLWTALNFFNAQQTNACWTRCNANNAQTNYDVVDVNPPWGHLTADGQSDLTVHACVYVADKVVFTKNGASETSPGC